jgi:hypothetical protein
MVIIPIILMTRLFFRKAGYNLLEHSVIIFYVFGHMYWLTIISLFIFKFSGTSGRMTIQFVVTILFFAFACSNFYTHNSKLKAFFKGMTVYLFGYLIFAIGAMAVGYLYILSTPEILELMKSDNK